jgi:plasmid stability protein
VATIQIRNVPEDVHRVYRTRAAAAGMSLQEYLRSELVSNAQHRTLAELLAEVEDEIRTSGGAGFAHGSSAGIIREDRESH